MNSLSEFSVPLLPNTQDVKAVAKDIARLAALVENNANGQIAKSDYAHIRELEFVYLYARELQYPDDADPESPNRQPDLSQNPSEWMKYRNRRDARALQEGIYKPLPFVAKWALTQGHSFGLMSKPRLEEIVREKEEKARSYAPCDAYWLLIIVEFIDPAQEQEIRAEVVSSFLCKRLK